MNTWPAGVKRRRDLPEHSCRVGRPGRTLGVAALRKPVAWLESLEPRVLLAGFDVYNPVTLIANAVSYRYAIPTAFDWNHDGTWDLLVGEWGAGSLGRVRLYTNSGSNAAPNLTFNSNISAGGSVVALGVG